MFSESCKKSRNLTFALNVKNGSSENLHETDIIYSVIAKPPNPELNQSFQCPFCENKVSSFKSRKDLVSHIDASHLENLNYSLHKSALNGKIKFYRKHIFSKETLHGFAANKKKIDKK